ncbi:hypothetical protein IWW34DRAFT_566458, partial [Fusarium oxysporum f. sp. albedinis]
IRGLSSLIILRKIMKEIASEQIGSCGPPELCPCDYFDYITGAGMGGYMIILQYGSLLRLTRDIRFVYAVQKDKGPCCIHTSDVRRSVVDPRKTSTSEIFRALTAAEGLFSEYTLEGTDGSRVTFLDHPYPWGFSNPTRKAVVLIRDTLRGVSIGVQPDDLIIVNIGSGQVAEADVGDLAILG